MTERPDDELVADAQRGDRAALESLLRRHHQRIYATCRRLCGNDADAADATQEALIAIVRGLPRYDGRSTFTTWAYRVATNAALDELRRRSRRPLAVLEGGGEGPGGDHRDPGGRASSLAPDLESAAVTRLDVDAALQQLPYDFRVAVVLRDQCGLDYAEIAEVLVIPPGTVRSRIARGRAHLVQLLEANAEQVKPEPGNPEPPTGRPSPRP